MLLPGESHEEDGERGWDGHLFQCFGRCDSHGCSSCGLVYCLPCLAFGCARGPRSLRGYLDTRSHDALVS